MQITKDDLIRSAAGLVTGGPLGIFLSPAVGRWVGGRWSMWALIGVVAGPFSWVVSSIPVALISGDLPKAPQSAPAPAPQAPPPPAVSSPPPQSGTVPQEQEESAETEAALNSHVSDNLNAADQAFKSGIDGCTNVTVAIMAANSPAIYGPTSKEQRAELKEYANRCNLRF